MSPQIERTPPPYMQVTDHYRRLIQEGSLPEGAKLPSVAEIAVEWGVAHATAAKAIGQLQIEGLILSSPRGSFVAARPSKGLSPRDRIVRWLRVGDRDAEGEVHEVIAAEIADPPAYVAELLDLEPGAQVVRREWTTGDVQPGGRSVRALTGTYYRVELATQVPELLSTDPAQVGALLSRVEKVAGKVRRGRDFYHGRAADQREASHLGLPVGAAILACTWLLWNPDQQVIEYGECVMPPRHTVSYPYDLRAIGRPVTQRHVIDEEPAETDE